MTKAELTKRVKQVETAVVKQEQLKLMWLRSAERRAVRIISLENRLALAQKRLTVAEKLLAS